MISIYVDGACKGNPGPGGWGVFLQKGTKERRLYGGEPETTNQRMELTAAIQGLAALKRPDRQVTIIADSEYVVKGMNEWLPGWKAKGWRTSAGKPVKNVDLWQKLEELSGQHSVTWQWVKGHSGNEGNEIADGLANQGCLEVMAGGVTEAVP